MATREVRGMGKMNKISSKNNSVEALDGFNEIRDSDEGFTRIPDSGGIASLEMDENLCSAEMGLVYSTFFHQKASEMLSFQGNNDRKSETANKSGISGSDTSSTSSSNNGLPTSLRTESQQKRRVQHDYGSVSGAGPGSVAGSLENYSVDSGKTLKKPKGETTPASTGPLKVRKEKLGERILALQQLVSPYGKTDTASVLHEAMEYIRFLQDQVQVLSSPYLKRIPSALSMEGGQEETNNDLRSRGLCLVPVACTLHVANSNGADFWSSAMGSSTSKH